MSKIYHYLILSAVLFSSALTQAQEQPSLREKANQFYLGYQYIKAKTIYLKLADVKKPRLLDLERLADCYLKMKDYEAAENWYSRIVQYPESKAENLILYGTVLKFNSHYTAAKSAFLRYAEQSDNAKLVVNEIAGCDSAVVWMAKPSNYMLKNEAQVNTTSAEFGVFPLKNKIYYVGEPNTDQFTRKDGRTGHPFLRIFTADRGPDQTLSAKLMNTSVYNEGQYHIGPISSNKNENLLFVTRTYTGKAGEISKTNQLSFKTSNLELYIYTLNKGKYEEIAFPYNNVQKYSVGHATLSPDEQTLYFVSDMPGGLGGTDLWYTELQTDGKWGIPQNAGAAINTPENEMFPFLDVAGNLYYSSNGFPGMGGLDIFVAKGAKNTWSKPVNLQYPVNSAADDFAFITTAPAIEGASGYLSSNRNGGVGDDDIYSFSSIKRTIILALKGVTQNKKTGEEIPDAAVSLYSNGRKLVAKQSSKTDGTFFFELEKGMDYIVLGQKEKFYSDSASITTRGLVHSDTLDLTLRLDPLFETGKTFTIQNIHYDFDKDNIRQDAAKILEELVRTMRDNPTLKIELGAHTDSRGLDNYNLNLSQRRASSVVDYLVSRGIARARLIAKGYGETQLLNRCANGIECSVAEHQANRRTEFKVLAY